MAKFAITFKEKVIHIHRLVIDCPDLETANELADRLDCCRLQHPDDITDTARRAGMKVEKMERDYCIDIDRMEIEDVDFISGEE